VLAPEAVNDWLEPDEMVAELGLMEIVGNAWTVTVWVAVQPLLSV
jgi:hypothetical protein